MSHFYVTCGERKVDGRRFGGEVTAVMLALLALKGTQETEKMAELFYEYADTKKLQANLENLKEQLSKLGVNECIVTPDNMVRVQNIETDFDHLLKACAQRDIDAIRQLPHEVFLVGLEQKMSGEGISKWIRQEEDLRVRSLWEVFLHLIHLKRISINELRQFDSWTKKVPDKKYIHFIYLYDLLKENHLLESNVGLKMVEAVSFNDEGEKTGLSLDKYVEQLRDSLIRNKTWQTPLELWKDPPITAVTNPTPIVSELKSPEPRTQLQESSESTLDTKNFEKTLPDKSRYSVVWGVVTGLLVLASLWALLGFFSSYLNTRGIMLIEAGEYSRALRFLQIAQSINRLGFQKATVAYNLANALESLGRYDEAKAYYQEAIRLDSNFPAPYNNLSRLLIAKEKNPQEALAWLDRAYELVEDDVALAEVKGVILKNRAWARYELGNYQTAQRDIEQALTLSPTMAALYCLDALLAEARGEDGLEHWENCVAYDVGETTVEANWRDLAQERLKP